MNNEHTPGPWNAVKWTCHAPTTIKAENGTVIAETTGFGLHSEECIPNARLIAAAPDLLEAAQRMNPEVAELLLAINQFRNHELSESQLIKRMEQVRQFNFFLRDAIAKAAPPYV